MKYPSIYQLEGFIARTYAAESQPAKALEHLKIAMEKEPNDVDLKLLHADLLIESGDKAGARAILDAVDMTKVKDPFPFMNAAITLINEKKGAEAVAIADQAAGAVPEPERDLLLPRPRVSVGQQDGRGQGRPREVRGGGADGEGSGRCEEDSRTDDQEVGGGEATVRRDGSGAADIRVRRIEQPRASDPSPPTSKIPARPSPSKKRPKPGPPPPILPPRASARRTSSTATRDGASSMRCGPIARRNHDATPRSFPRTATPNPAIGAQFAWRLHATTSDVGEIAVVQDEGDLILPPNTYDLRSLGLRFTRNAAGGYDVVRIDGAFRSGSGDPADADRRRQRDQHDPVRLFVLRRGRKRPRS